jgi:hypothetical protein
LEKVGDLSVIDALLGHAKDDKSPAIRHNSADAISDILSRYRLPPHAEEVSFEQRMELFHKFMGVFPGHNNATFLMFASLGIEQARDQILSGFLHPRSEVRLGAFVGLLRYCLSASTLGDKNTEQSVLEMLKLSRLSADATVHLARICAEVSYASALPVLRGIDLDGKHGETIEAAIDQLEKSDESMDGLWFSDGKDAGEYNPTSRIAEAYLAINNGQASFRTELDDIWLPYIDFENAPKRRMWFRRVGQPAPGPAIQVGFRTYYMAPQASAHNLMESEAIFEPGTAMEGYKVLAAVLEKKLDTDVAKILRNLGLIWMRAHQFESAMDTFERAIAGKRTPIDTYFYLAECACGLGDMTRAKASWEACLGKTRSPTSAMAQLCRERLDGVGE